MRRTVQPAAFERAAECMRGVWIHGRGLGGAVVDIVVVDWITVYLIAVFT